MKNKLLFLPSLTPNLLSITATVTIFLHSFPALFLCLHPHECVCDPFFFNPAISHGHAIISCLIPLQLDFLLACLLVCVFTCLSSRSDLWCEVWSVSLFPLGGFWEWDFWVKGWGCFEGSWCTRPPGSPNRLCRLSSQQPQECVGHGSSRAAPSPGTEFLVFWKCGSLKPLGSFLLVGLEGISQ